jgi:hypothetical protein
LTSDEEPKIWRGSPTGAGMPLLRSLTIPARVQDRKTPKKHRYCKNGEKNYSREEMKMKDAVVRSHEVFEI